MIILLGIPLIIVLVVHLRQKRIEYLMECSMEKIRNDVDALIQIQTIKYISIGKVGSKTSGENIDYEMKVKGIINLHVEECKNELCMCRNLEELYDVGQAQFLTPTQELHNETIFINHYNKKLYDEALNKFINSPSIHISFSYYLFSVMKNIHAALHELNIANKKKPTIQQQFTIFRYKKIIEQYFKAEEFKTKHIYQQLTNVKEFERLHQEMSKAIEAVCNYSVEFWSHLTTAIPDLNVLSDLGQKIHISSHQADSYWKELCKINPAYPGALQQYGEYLSLIRNHPQVGKQYIEKSQTTNFAHNSMDEHLKKSDILFTEDTTVLHISGNKESSGRVLKVSQGFQKCFGYTKQEVIGHNLNFLMPSTIGNRHNDFLERFYKTGRQRVFNVERLQFAQNKQGHCFSVKVLVKQMPSLKEGIQYVGMIRPVFTEHDYIITDMNGNVDCFSKGITSLLGLNPQVFKENKEINIMILCPELIDIFEQRRKLIKQNTQLIRDIRENKDQASQKVDPDQVFGNSKLSQPGGDTLAIIVPQNFAAIAQSEKTTKGRPGNKKKQNGAQDTQDIAGAQKITRSIQFREFLKYLQKGRTYSRKQPDIKKLLNSPEYRQNEKLKIVQCELVLKEVRINRSAYHALKYLVFMVNRTNGKRNQENGEDGDEVFSEHEEQDQNQMLKQASNVIQEIFGIKDDQGGLLNIGINQGFNNNQSNNTIKKAFTQEELNQQQAQLSKFKPQHSNNPSKEPEKIGTSSYQQVDLRRESQQITGYKSVGFADDVIGMNKQVGLQQTEGPNPNTQQQKQYQNSFAGQSNKKSQMGSNFDSFQQPGNRGQNANSTNLKEFKATMTFIDVNKSQETNNQRSKGSNLAVGADVGNNNNSIRDIEVSDEDDDDESSILNQTDKKKKQVQLMEKPQVLGKPENPKNPQINTANAQKNQLLSVGIPKSPQEKETPRIDVKKDIQINDNIKKKTASLSESVNGKRASKKGSQRPFQMRISSNNQILNSFQNNNVSAEDKKNVIDQESSQQTSSIVSKRSSLKSQKKSLTQIQKPKDEQKQRLLDDNDQELNQDVEGEIQPNKDQNSDNEDMQEQIEEEFEEEIEEIIEEIDEGLEDDDYGNEEMMSQQDMNSMQNLSPNKSQRSNGSGTNNGDHNMNLTGGTNPASMNAFGDYSGGMYGGPAPQPVKKKKLRNYEKIVTGFKYRHYDIESCGSVLFKDWEFTNEELDIRELIKKVEGRKQRREQRRKKKLKAEEQSQTPEKKKKPDEDKQEDNDDEDGEERDEGSDDKPKEEEKEEEESNEEDNQNKHKLLKDEIDEGEVSSIASSIFSQTRSYFSLRNAIDEKFIPLGIRNLKHVAQILFLSLLVLNISQYVIQQRLFVEVNENIQNIHYSEQRINDIIDMNLRIQNLRFLNEGLLTQAFIGNMSNTSYLTFQNRLLLESSTSLKDSQNQLSVYTAPYDDDIRNKINPEDVKIEYENVTGIQSVLYYNIWESVVKVVVGAFQLANEPTAIVTNNSIVKFVQNNCLNQLLLKLNYSTQAIIEAIDYKKQDSMSLFLYLLISVSCALLLTIAFLIPVINRAKRQKQEVLELFLNKKIEKSIDDQLKLCRWFITKYQVQTENVGVVAGGDIEGDGGVADDNIGGMNEKDLKKEKEELYNMKKQKKKKKKWRKLNVNFGFLMIRLLMIVAILEAFFLASYLSSQIFMSEVTSLTDELRLLISRQPLYTLVLLMQKELFYTNGTAMIYDTNVKSVLKNYSDQLIDDQQRLLEIFSQNYNYHTESYNREFNELIYSNMCQNLQFNGSSQTECENFNLGILQKGLYSTLTKYLSSLSQVNSRFQILRMANETAKDYINDPKIIISETTCDLYMKQIHSHLVNILEEDINQFFSNEQKQDIAIFIIFLGYMFFIYFFVWRIFLSRLLDELWRAKSLLSIIPVEICFKLEEIRNFIYANSSNSQFQ